jgi:YVTN family beta-propeller protein
MRRSHLVSSVCLSFVLAACGGAPTDGSRGQELGQSSAELLGALHGEELPTGARITPTAAPGSQLMSLNPDLAANPTYLADHAVSTAESPDGKTLLVLTSGYNLNNVVATGSAIPDQSTEYVFVYDISVNPPVKRQVIQVPNTFVGMAWNPSGNEFYVSSGGDDGLHVYAKGGSAFAEIAASPIAFHHGAAVGLQVAAASAGLAVDASGTTAVVANYENDSVSIVDLTTHTLVADVDLRPGKVDPSQSGVAGGEYPYGVVIKGNDRAYVSSQRDREVVIVDFKNGSPPHVAGRIAVGGQPNKMILDRKQSRLYVANGTSDTVSIIDTKTNTVLDEVGTTAPAWLFANREGLKGANPNALALSHDERTLYVTNGGTNSVAVIRLGDGDDDDDHDDRSDPEDRARLVGLIPTGWYPNDVSVSQKDDRLYVINAKSPTKAGCLDTAPPNYTSYYSCWNGNQYLWTLEKAGFLTIPVPSDAALNRLTWQVASNNGFQPDADDRRGERVMQALSQRIKHVVYIIKENRTYDQVLGDLPVGNGDPSLTIFGAALTPNFHSLATKFVALDNFRDSGETSGVGWNWTMGGRTTDAIEKTQPVNYAGRGFNYDWEGTNRNVNVGLGTVAERQAALPFFYPADPDLLPGTADVSAGEAAGHEGGTSYLWDAALRKGLSLRNYGVFGDLSRYFIPPSLPIYVPLDRHPFDDGVVQFYPAKAALQSLSDPYFRGYDNAYPDFWRFKEWEREFDQAASSGSLPNLMLVRFMHDHFGSFGSAIDGVNTPPLQIADNDYAVGLLVDKIAHSPFKKDTLVFVIEDDAQDGPDHVDGHRSIAFVAGPYVKQGAVISSSYNTVSMVRTITGALGLSALGLTDGLAPPMSNVFDLDADPNDWSYTALVPAILRTSALPLPPPTAMNESKSGSAFAARAPRHDAAYWERVTAGQDFTREDALDVGKFNQALWHGVMGELAAYPATRDQRDLSSNREDLLAAARGGAK